MPVARGKGTGKFAKPIAAKTIPKAIVESSLTQILKVIEKAPKPKNVKK